MAHVRLNIKIKRYDVPKLRTIISYYDPLLKFYDQTQLLLRTQIKKTPIISYNSFVYNTVKIRHRWEPNAITLVRGTPKIITLVYFFFIQLNCLTIRPTMCASVDAAGVEIVNFLMDSREINMFFSLDASSHNYIHRRTHTIII